MKESGMTAWIEFNWSSGGSCKHGHGSLGSPRLKTISFSKRNLLHGINFRPFTSINVFGSHTAIGIRLSDLF
jgi:hypothetical protein